MYPSPITIIIFKVYLWFSISWIIINNKFLSIMALLYSLIGWSSYIYGWYIYISSIFAYGFPIYEKYISRTNDLCGICLEENVDQRHINIFPCGHWGHDECCDNCWRRQQFLCPFCREHIQYHIDYEEICWFPVFKISAQIRNRYYGSSSRSHQFVPSRTRSYSAIQMK